MKRGLTIRSSILGLLMVLVSNLGDPYTLTELHSSFLAFDYLPLGLIFPFTVIVVGNILLKAIHSEWGLHPQELLIVFVMGMIGSVIPTILIARLIGTIAAPYYFSTPENQWASYFHRYIPIWITPSDEHRAMQWFFEGLPKGESIPWGAWVVPLFWWFSFIAAFSWVCFCTVALLQKQWIERERVTFPLVRIPLDMIAGSDERSFLPPCMQKRLFWVGFSLSFSIILWNIIGYFSPFFPRIQLGGGSLEIARGFPAISTTIDLRILGLAFLIPLNISLSIWFFALLSAVQVGIYNRLGFTIGPGDVYCDSDASMGWESFGAYIFMVLWGLWMARGHLREVVRIAWRGDREQEGLLTYRVALVGFIVGLVYMIGWLAHSGMTWNVITLFLFATFILHVGAARIVAETGLISFRGPVIPQPFVMYTMGSKVISGASMASLAFSYSHILTVKNVFMPVAIQVPKLMEAISVRRHEILLAIGIAAVVGIGVSTWYLLTEGYERGAYNFGFAFFDTQAMIPFDNIVSKMKNPFGPHVGTWSFLGIGMTLMAILTYLHYKLTWWPLHPIGLVVSSVSYVWGTALTIFLAWAAKSLIVRLGGIGLYQ
ncbi:MAG: hypothetical protein HY709_04790, partial [Candidatus Latescibacteria bacterium]|nr:hypothetical protein [Candidatus Latescibacterota bacterium]